MREGTFLTSEKLRDAKYFEVCECISYSDINKKKRKKNSETGKLEPKTYRYFNSSFLVSYD